MNPLLLLDIDCHGQHFRQYNHPPHQGLLAFNVTVTIYGWHHDWILCVRTSLRFLMININGYFDEDIVDCE